MAFIPPPFPFPEAWPRVFAEQQQRQERRWLTPTTFAPVQWQPAEGFSSKYQTTGTEVAMTVDSAQDEEDDEEGEYEYGYVLSDEWRERFRASVQLQPPPKRNRPKKKKKPQQKKLKPQRQTVNAEAVAAASASRSGHLQREVQAAKTRELARKWKLRGRSDATAAIDPQIAALETALNMQFDEFCDAFQPVVWPHEPLQR